MNKILKTTAAVTVAIVLGSGAVFARGIHSDKNHPDFPSKMDRMDMMKNNNDDHLPPPGPHMDFDMHATQDEAVIGKIKSFDKESGKLSVALTDGKTKEITVTPFARVSFMPKAPAAPAAENSAQPAPAPAPANGNSLPPQPKTLDQAAANSWILVKLFKTEGTENVAAHILVAE